MRTKFVVVVSVVTLVLLIVLVMAIDTQSTGWKVTSTEKTVDVYSNCKTVVTTSGPDVFAPTNTVAEWNAFIANKPASVTLGSCGPDCNQYDGVGRENTKVMCYDVAADAESSCQAESGCWGTSNTGECEFDYIWDLNCYEL